MSTASASWPKVHNFVIRAFDFQAVLSTREKEMTYGSLRSHELFVSCREQLVGERKVELERLQKESTEAAAQEAKEADRLKQEERKYGMELQVQTRSHG